VAVTLNERAFSHAEKLLRAGAMVLDDRDDWSEHQPSARQENDFLAQHGFGEYARWYLGIDDEHGEETKGRYRCGVIAAEVRAAQNDHRDIERAAAHLHGMLDAHRAG
jgi:hypothetical protein